MNALVIYFIYRPPISSSSTIVRPSTVSLIQKRQLSEVSHIPEKKLLCYKSFEEFKKRILLLSLKGWSIQSHDSYVVIQKVNSSFVIPEFEVYVDVDLKFSLRIFGWFLKQNQNIYLKYRHSLENITLSNLIYLIESFVISDGVKISGSNIVQHSVPLAYKYGENHSTPLHVKV